MLSCENTDIEFNGKLYHVQTEDWGRDNPFVVTRVFSGGKVLGSIKTNYRSWLSLEDKIRSLKLRQILSQQHLESISKIKQGHWY
jgi:hypothetical protein